MRKYKVCTFFCFCKTLADKTSSCSFSWSNFLWIGPVTWYKISCGRRKRNSVICYNLWKIGNFMFIVIRINDQFSMISAFFYILLVDNKYCTIDKPAAHLCCIFFPHDHHYRHFLMHRPALALVVPDTNPKISTNRIVSLYLLNNIQDDIF